MKLTFKKTPAEIAREAQEDEFRKIVQDEQALDLLSKKDQAARPDYIAQPLGEEPRIQALPPGSTETSETAEARVKAEESFDPLTQSLIEAGAFDPSIVATTADALDETPGEEAPEGFDLQPMATTPFSNDPAFINKQIESEIKSQTERATRATTETYAAQSADEMRSTIPQAQQGRDVYGNIIARGSFINDTLSKRISPMLMADDPVSRKVQGFLASTQLFDQTSGRMTDRVGNALAITFLETAADVFNKTDESLDVSSMRDEQAAGDGIFDPELIRERMASSLADKLLPNPNEMGDPNIRMGYGGAGAALDPDVKAALDVLIYDMFTTPEQNLFQAIDLNANDPNTDLKDERLVLTEEGEAFFRANRGILEDIQPDRRVNVAYLPPAVNQFPGRERELGEKAKPLSKRNKTSKNTAFEDAVKLRLSTIPMRVDDDRFAYAKMIVASVIQLEPAGPGEADRITLINAAPGGLFFSNNKWAKTLGLHEAKWLEAYSNAKKRFGEGREVDAQDQANKVMRMQARKIIRTMNDATANQGKVYYNKYMHASSVGRYFVRNTVLNYQTDKLVRNIVGSAKKVLVNIKSGDKITKQIMENWTYIIGKNLLDPDLDNNYNPTNGLRTEDMGWNNIIDITKSIMSNPNDPVYQTWLRQGQALRAAVKSGDMNTFNQATNAGRLHQSSLKKNDNWGYKLQAFIDFANWHDAKTKGLNSLELKAQVQHDGKQNGIAIQALQNGDTDDMKRVGVIFGDEGNILSQGDIRDKFLDTAMKQIGIPFAHNPDKQNFWSEVLTEIYELPADQRSDMVKALSKVPLMETSYGMPARFHMETAQEFIDDAGKDIIAKVIARHENLSDYSRMDRISDLNNVIGQGLTILNLQQQQLYKNAGKLWAMLGVVPELVGPLGTTIYMGTNEHFRTGRTIPIQTEEGIVNLEMTEARATGSAGKRTRMRVFDPETGKYRLADRSRFGQLVANQLPVLTVQQIDAAVMANTIMKVNDMARVRKEGAAFVMPVHDAIITDATSVKAYHREINNQFKQVNMNYSISKAITDGLKAAMASMRAKAARNPGMKIAVNYESEYRALHDHLVMLSQGLDQLTAEFETTEGRKAVPKVNLRGPAQKLLDRAIKAGWRPEGGEISMQAYEGLISDIAAQKLIISDLEQRHKANESLKSKIWKLISKVIYQYN